MKAQIKREFTLILIGSLLIGVFFRVGWFFPIRLMVMSTLLINFALTVCMWYSEANNRPILYQVMVIFYIGVTAYCIASMNESELFGIQYDGKFVMRVSLLFLMGVLLASLVSIKPIMEVGKKRIDLWIPPLWPVVLAGVASYLSNRELENEAVRMSVILVMGGFILTTAYKNNRMQNKSVAYKVATKHYLLYLCLFAFLIFCVNELIPKGDELPGTAFMKNITNNWGKGISGDIETTSKLSRNPSQSEDMVLQVKNEGAVYLRKVAYSDYKDGEWSIPKEDDQLKSIKKEDLYNEETLFRVVLDKMKEGKVKDKDLLKKYKKYLELPSNEPLEKEAYIQEVKPFDCYFTIEGLNQINVSDKGQIGYFYDIDNLCFASTTKSEDIAYTINYTQDRLNRGTRELAVAQLLTQRDFMKILDATEFSEEDLSEEIMTLIEKNEQYDVLYYKYTGIPDDIVPYITNYASKITEGMDSDLSKAEAICNQLKNSGIYTYELGAPYTGNTDDPIVDFLFYGKKGICQDFASSMTLLCRGAELPARYVVGYYSVERDDNKEMTYDVRVKDCHAFVEVYIAGYGWMTFDPTPNKNTDSEIADEVVEQGDNNNIQFNIGDIKLLIIIAIIFIAILFWMYPAAWLRRRIWQWYVLKMPPKRAMHLLMKQTIKLLEDKSIFLEDKETVSQLAKRLSNQYLVDITLITKPFEDCYYGGKMPQKSDIYAAMNCYKQLARKKVWKLLTDPDRSA